MGSRGDERESLFTHGAFGDALPCPVISCLKGQKGVHDTSPNQDNFSFLQLANGYTMACCHDGHGPDGHRVSTRTVRTLPHFLTQSSKYPSDIKGALKEAFELSQQDVVSEAICNGWDVEASGSTAVVAIWKGDTVWTANVGDSKCIVGNEVGERLVFQTKDHRPDDPEEKKRIEASGGEIKSRTYMDGLTVHRIFAKGLNFPGLCMSRTLGDVSVKDQGVTAEPDVSEVKVDLAAKPFLLLASDGVWEFLRTDFVVKAIARRLALDGPHETIKKLTREAQKRWRRDHRGEYCDDISAIFVQLT